MNSNRDTGVAAGTILIMLGILMEYYTDEQIKGFLEEEKIEGAMEIIRRREAKKSLSRLLEAEAGL